MQINTNTAEPSHYIRKQNVTALAAFVDHRVSIGDEATLLTFMFAKLRGNSVAKMAQMRDAIEGFYGRFVTRVVRRPSSAVASGLPGLLAAIDRPGAGSLRLGPAEITLNDGLHAHGILLVRPNSRLRVGADQHVRDQQQLYLRDQRLVRMDARAISHSPGRALQYAFKSVASGRVDYDGGVVILPRSRSEMT